MTLINLIQQIVKFIKYLRTIIFSATHKKVEKQNIRLEQELNELKRLEKEQLTNRKKTSE